MVWPVVRLHVRPCGERVPILVDRDTGAPLALPAIYVMTVLRSRATNTIAQHLLGVQILLLWCQAEGICLDDRIDAGKLFRAHELDALWDATARPVAHFSEKTSPRGRSPRKLIKPGQAVSSLARDTVGNRRGAVRRYLAWLTERRLFALGHQPDAQQKYRLAREELLRSLAARSRTTGGRWRPMDLGRSALETARNRGSVANEAPSVTFQRFEIYVSFSLAVKLR